MKWTENMQYSIDAMKLIYSERVRLFILLSLLLLLLLLLFEASRQVLFQSTIKMVECMRWDKWLPERNKRKKNTQIFIHNWISFGWKRHERNCDCIFRWKCVLLLDFFRQKYYNRSIFFRWRASSTTNTNRPIHRCKCNCSWECFTLWWHMRTTRDTVCVLIFHVYLWRSLLKIYRFIWTRMFVVEWKRLCVLATATHSININKSIQVRFSFETLLDICCCCWFCCIHSVFSF